MAIKYNNQDVKQIYYNGDPVYTLKKDGVTTWARAYYVSALPSSGSITRGSYLNPITNQSNIIGDIYGITTSSTVKGKIVFARYLSNSREDLVCIPFAYSPIGLIDAGDIGYQAVTGGGGISLTNGGKPFLTLWGDVETEAVYLDTQTIGNKTYYMTSMMIYSGNAKIKLVFGYSRTAMLSFDGIYYQATGTDPNTTRTWARIEKNNTYAAAWYLSDLNSVGYQGIIDDTYPYTKSATDQDVWCESPGPEPTSNYREVTVGSYVYYGDELCDYNTNEFKKVEAVDVDNFSWYGGNASFPAGTFSSNASKISYTGSSSCPTFCSSTITFKSYTGKNVETTSTKTTSGDESWSVSCPTSWIQADISYDLFVGEFLQKKATTIRHPSAPTSLDALSMSGSRSSVGVTIAGVGDYQIEYKLYIPSTLTGVAMYVEYNATFYYGTSSRSISDSTTVTASLADYKTIVSDRDASLVGGTISATVYAYGLTKSFYVEVGELSGGGGDTAASS